MTTDHQYELTVRWTGDRGAGTANYRAYGREHEVVADGKPPLPGSADPAFRGDPARWSPEELLVSSLSQCHLLWYLHLCATGGVVVTGYTDRPVGTMRTDGSGAGRFTEVVLRPEVTVADSSMRGKAEALHGEAGELCFIARSVDFPVRHEPVVRVRGAA